MTDRPALNRLSYCVTPLTMFKGDVELSRATGFFYTVPTNGVRCFRLVSNWHVFSGRHTAFPNAALDKQLQIPDTIMFEVMKVVGEIIETYEIRTNLYNGTEAIWKQHQSKNAVDVALIDLGSGPENGEVLGVNEVANQWDMKIEIGDDVFVLGYPLNFSHFARTAIWKRGTIASEPNYVTPDSNNRIILDATTRSGMSGSPVILRQKTHYVSESGAVVEKPNASRILGVYSSRPNFTPTGAAQAIDGFEDKRAEVGYMVKSGYIQQIIEEGICGPRYGELP